MRKIEFNNQQYLYKPKLRSLDILKTYRDNFQVFEKNY
jgi:hypothetical protein